MKTDRELLELAARAAGIARSQWDYDWVRGLGHMVCRSDMWNPITHDGDALRLAVDLSFDLNINPGRIEVFSGDLDDCVSEPVIDGNVRSATRRAIVRAAAAIGEQMK